jgi:hypothetical protein
MTNINKDTLIENFISDEEIISSISLNNRNVIDYYVKKDKNENYLLLSEII